MVSAGNANFGPSSALNAIARQVGLMAAQRADPALLGHHDGDRLAHHHRLFDRGLVVLGRLGEIGAALAERRLRAECLAHLLDLVGDRLPLLLLGADQLLDAGLLLAQLLVLGPDLHLFELAQVAQPHVEDGVGLHVGELEGLHQDGLGLVLVADDLDDLVEVEIGDQEAAEHFEPVVDLRQPMLRAPHQHLAAMVEPFVQDLGQAHDLGDPALGQHVHVERDAALELGQLEQRLHQDAGIDRARLRLDDEAHVLGRTRRGSSSTSGSFFSLISSAIRSIRPVFLHEPGNFA